MSDFAERLNLLFATFLQPATSPGRRQEEWSNAAVARVAVELHASDTTVLTRQYLGMLRNGERAHPSLRSAIAIADAFAELARRSGRACEPTELLTFLAGSYTPEPGVAPDTAGLGRPTAPSEQRAEDDDATPAVLARLGDGSDDDQSRAVKALIDELSRPDAEPMRRKLARLLGRSDQL